MKVNVEFLIVSYIVSAAVDWILQTQWQANNKSKWSKGSNYLESLFALLSHSFFYALFTTCIVNIILSLSDYQILTMLPVLFISHFIIDNRIIVKLIMRLKGMTKEQINDHTNFGFMHIGIDQRLHELVLLYLAIII